MVRAERLLDRFAARPLRVRGLRACARMLGVAAALVHLADYGARSYLYGPGAALPADQTTSQLPWIDFSLYTLSDAQPWFEVVFNLGLLAAVALAVVPRRWLVVTTWLLVTGLQARNPFVLDGGDTLLRVGLLYLMLVDWRFGPETAEETEAAGASTDSILLHNAAVVLLVGQLVVTYALSSTAKVASSEWRSGDAIGLIFGLEQFNRFPGSIPGAVPAAALAWTVIVVEALLPVALLVRRTRGVAVAAAISLHTAIALIMGLTSFSLAMLAFVAVTVPDRSWPAGLCRRPRRDVIGAGVMVPAASPSGAGRSP